MNQCRPLRLFAGIDDIVGAVVIGSACKINLCAVEQFKHTAVDLLLFVNLRRRSHETFFVGNVAMKVGQRGPVDGFERLCHAQQVVVSGIHATGLTLPAHQSQVVEVEIGVVPFVAKR